MPRLFVAVRIRSAPRLRQVLDAIAHVRGVKAVAPENLHYTLRFLGDVDDASAARLRQHLPAADLGVTEPFVVEMAGLGTFPGPKRPRVVWVGCDPAGAQRLARLAQGVDRIADALDLGTRDKPFAPHLTIARVKHLDGRGRTVIQGLLQEHLHTSFGTAPVDQVALVQSTLTPQGPQYQDVATCRLGAPGEAEA